MIMSQEAIKQHSSITHIIFDIAGSIRRFPLETLIAGIFTLFHVFELDKDLGLQGDETIRVSLALISGFFWTLSVSLFSQKSGLNKIARIGIVITGLISVALLHTFPDNLGFNYVLFLPALIILLSLAPYTDHQSKEAEFWLYNHHLWLGYALAVLAGILFAGGFSLILETINQLFGIKVPRDLFTDIWIIGLGYIFPLAWLSFIPKKFDEAVVEGKQTEFTSAAIAMIVKFILVPLLLAYTAILYAYTIKILIDGVLPKGILGSMVLAYGAIGTITVLFAFPTRFSGGPIITFFWRYWFLLTIVPIILLVLAVYQRIDQYGWTTSRYLVVMAGVWLSILALLYSIKRERRDFRIIVGLLCIMLVFSSLGPWSARNIGAISQVSKLKILLESNGILKNEKIQLIEHEDKKISAKDLKRIRSILFYLSREGQLDRLASLFTHLNNTPFPIKDNSKTYHNGNKIIKFIGLNKLKTKENKLDIYYSQNYRAEPIDLNEYAYISGPFTKYVSLRGCNNNKTEKKKKNTCPYIDQIGTINNQNLSLEWSPTSLKLKENKEVISQYNIQEMLNKVSSLTKKQEKTKEKKKKPILFPANGSKYPVSLLVEQLSGKMQENKVLNYNMRIWVLIGENGTP